MHTVVQEQIGELLRVIGVNVGGRVGRADVQAACGTLRNPARMELVGAPCLLCETPMPGNCDFPRALVPVDVLHKSLLLQSVSSPSY